MRDGETANKVKRRAQASETHDNGAAHTQQSQALVPSPSPIDPSLAGPDDDDAAALNPQSTCDPPDLVFSEISLLGAALPGSVPVDATCFPQLALPPLVQPNIPFTVYAACYINGSILGLSCGAIVPAKSRPAPDPVPPPLRPTAIQLITIHPPHLDLFPFPRFRDNAITMNTVFDIEEFLFDFYTGASFQIVPGRATWDPRAWRIEKCFADKWGYLFV